MVKVHIFNLISNETKVVAVPTIVEANALEARYNLEEGDNFFATVEAE
jgi:hypothetical protein